MLYTMASYCGVGVGVFKYTSTCSTVHCTIVILFFTRLVWIKFSCMVLKVIKHCQCNKCSFLLLFKHTNVLNLYFISCIHFLFIVTLFVLLCVIFYLFQCSMNWPTTDSMKISLKSVFHYLDIWT